MSDMDSPEMQLVKQRRRAAAKAKWRERYKKWSWQFVLAEAFLLPLLPSAATAALLIASVLTVLRFRTDAEFKFRQLSFDVPAALFILLQYAFVEVMTRAGEAREKEMLELNMNTMMDTASDVTAKSEAAYANLSDNLKADIGMMVNYLKEYADEDGYTGPRVFFDGAVAELRDGQV